jgi:hypothetical protein
MDNNELLMIVLAFVVGYMASNMMKNMCGQRLVEGDEFEQTCDPTESNADYKCSRDYESGTSCKQICAEGGNWDPGAWYDLTEWFHTAPCTSYGYYCN